MFPKRLKSQQQILHYKSAVEYMDSIFSII